jgi:hypothetical protein
MLFISFIIAAFADAVFTHNTSTTSYYRLQHYKEQNEGEYEGYYFQFLNLLFITTESFVNTYFNKNLFGLYYLQQDISSCIGGQGTLP